MDTKLKQEYNQDFYAWALHNAELIRQRKFSEVDIEHVAEEIESMGRRERREFINRLAILLAHILKWQYQPKRRGNSWKYTIKEQRLQAIRLLEENPSLKHEIDILLNYAYEEAVIISAGETNLPEFTFPKKCSFTLHEILDQQFFPE